MVCSFLPISQKLSEKNFDDVRTHLGFPVRPIAGGRATWRAPFSRYQRAFET
jgi:hypothetical protein